LTFPVPFAVPDCPGDEVCCDADREEREIKKNKARNGQAANFIDKHFSWKSSSTDGRDILQFYQSHIHTPQTGAVFTSIYKSLPLLVEVQSNFIGFMLAEASRPRVPRAAIRVRPN
jgi:hypothetical protein